MWPRPDQIGGQYALGIGWTVYCYRYRVCPDRAWNVVNKRWTRAKANELAVREPTPARQRRVGGQRSWRIQKKVCIERGKTGTVELWRRPRGLHPSGETRKSGNAAFALALRRDLPLLRRPGDKPPAEHPRPRLA